MTPILLLFRRYYVILFCKKQAIRLKSTPENVLLVQGVFCLIPYMMIAKVRCL